MDPLHEHLGDLGDLMESITWSLAAPVVINGTLNTIAQNKGHRAIGEAIDILRELFSKESSALHMRMGQMWSAEPNRAIVFVKSQKKRSKKGLSGRTRRPWRQWNRKMIRMIWALIDGRRNCGSG